MESGGATPPVSITRLKQIANDACDSALTSATAYSHTNAESWNNSIVSKILQSLASESKPASAPSPAFKFAVTSTIIQLYESASGSSGGGGAPANREMSPPPEEQPASGSGSATTAVAGTAKRGMHSAAGAYWNMEKDGLWTYKYEGAEAKGMDVVLCVMWIAI